MNDNRRRLYTHLKQNVSKVSSDPLYQTKVFLKQYQIPEKDFFDWIIQEGREYNFQIESDVSVMKAMI